MPRLIMVIDGHGGGVVKEGAQGRRGDPEEAAQQQQGVGADNKAEISLHPRQCRGGQRSEQGQVHEFVLGEHDIGSIASHVGTAAHAAAHPMPQLGRRHR